MTLIVAIVTDEYVVLASDRRVTWRRGTRTVFQEDSAMKTFVFGGHFLVGFTGVAKIGQDSIEEWLSGVLVGVPVHEMLLAVQVAAQDVFDRTPALSGQQHTFLGVGFARRSGDGEYIPVGFYISNNLDSQGRPNHRRVNGQFLGRKMMLGNQKHHVVTIGWDVRDEDRRALDGAVRTALRADPRNPLLVLRPTVELMRHTAARSGGAVGETILFSALPKANVPVEGWALPVAGVPLDATGHPVALTLRENELTADPSFMYLPAMYTEDASWTQVRFIEGEPDEQLPDTTGV